jgi:hypothetical protein
MQGCAAETLVRWDLEEKDGVTTVRLTHSGLTSESSRARNSSWPLILGVLQASVEARLNPASDRCFCWKKCVAEVARLAIGGRRATVLAATIAMASSTIAART